LLGGVMAGVNPSEPFVVAMGSNKLHECHDCEV
jgi:hypothetical protein